MGINKEYNIFCSQLLKQGMAIQLETLLIILISKQGKVYVKLASVLQY